MPMNISSEKTVGKGKKKEKKIKEISPVKETLENQENDENIPLQANLQKKEVSPKEKKRGKGLSFLFGPLFLIPPRAQERRS
jgi:hypothetical protein